MNSENRFKYYMMIFMLSMILAGCGDTGRDDAEFPWSISISEMSVRLIIRDRTIELGQYPDCVMEVMNTSKQTILLRKDFSLNGPAVYDANGNPSPQKQALNVEKVSDATYYRIAPGQKISVKTKPNYRMDNQGRYALKFAVNPEWWGYEDPQNPDAIKSRDVKNEPPAISNDVPVVIY